jgi:hypothetical protein
VDCFTNAYIEAALWSSNDDEGEPLDQGYCVTDIASETLAQMVADCARFQRENAELLSQAGGTDRQNGVDFWLNRVGHGAGFWDRGYGEIGDRLSDAADAYRDLDLVVGDDGRIYAE